MMVANVAYQSIFSAPENEDQVIDKANQKLKSNQQDPNTAHKVYQEDNDDLQNDSLNVQEVGRNHLAGEEGAQAESSSEEIAAIADDDDDFVVREHPETGEQIKIAKKAVKMHVHYCIGWQYKGSLMQI